MADQGINPGVLGQHGIDHRSQGNHLDPGTIGLVPRDLGVGDRGLLIDKPVVWGFIMCVHTAIHKPRTNTPWRPSSTPSLDIGSTTPTGPRIHAHETPGGMEDPQSTLASSSLQEDPGVVAESACPDCIPRGKRSVNGSLAPRYPGESEEWKD